MAMRPEISVMVPAHNEADVIQRTLRSLTDQTADRASYEILVIDDGSTDRTPEVVKRYIRKHDRYNIRLIRKEKAGGKSSALNWGISDVKGDIVLITDADNVVAPDWIEIMARGLKEHDMVQGAWYGYRPKGTMQKVEHAQYLAQYRYGGLYVRLTRNGANNGFRKKVYEKAGPFSEKSTVVTQGFYQRGLDAGFSLTYLPDSEVYTLCNSRLRTYVGQRLRWREYDSAGSLMRTGVKGLLFTLGLSTLTFLTIFVLPFLHGYLPLILDRFIPWWSVWHLIPALLAFILACDYARYIGPYLQMKGKNAREDDRQYGSYLLLLPLVLFLLRILTIPYYVYRLLRPRRSGTFEAVRS